MLNDILENSFIQRLAASLPRSPLQQNGLQESDAELIRLPGTSSVLAITTDSIVEEIESGLYEDPYLIGWMTVMVNASDLAAVGADPVGILLNETLPPAASEDFLVRLQEGIRDACSATGLAVLGGDTNFASRLQMGASAVGIVPDARPTTRIGCQPGDILVASGPLGLGNAYAFVQLGRAWRSLPSSVPFMPKARVWEGRLLREFASCCMDTSDGAFATLDQLMRLNNTGFVLESKLEEFLHPVALDITGAAALPPWLTLAGPHGEFELLFTIPPERTGAFMETASTVGWTPLVIGKVVEEPGVWFTQEEKKVYVDTGRIRNLSLHTDGDIHDYIHQLLLTVEKTVSI